jgi:alkylhydroperoxidase/carboxymuconolactone decarboxylase family protein YurZ
MSEQLSYEERHQRAAEVFSRFAPEVEPERIARSMQRRLGALGSFAFDAVGNLWARPQLSRRDRSLAVIAILGALGQENELAVHVPGGLNHGLTRTEIEEIMVHLSMYAGFPKAVDGMRAVRAAFAKIDERAGRA